MSELHIIEKPITRQELKKVAEERFGDLAQRELIGWVNYQLKFYQRGEITKKQLKEVLILGIENILDK